MSKLMDYVKKHLGATLQNGEIVELDKGYAVADGDYLNSVIVWWDDGKALARCVKNYFKYTDEDEYVGVWIDGKDRAHVNYTSVVELYSSAMILAKEREQDYIYDFKQKKCIEVV